MSKTDPLEIRELKPNQSDYPERVLELPGRPRVLRTCGDLDLLNQGPALAVVGTRTPTPVIEKDTARVVEVAAEFAMVIVSGISPGVDIVAHEAALKAKLKTIAVPGCGINALLASPQGKLARRIVDNGGLILSPFPNDSAESLDRRWWRNRIIAALCHGLVVVASEVDGGAWEAHRWARRLERMLISPEIASDTAAAETRS
jgi:DNA processing protein